MTVCAAQGSPTPDIEKKEYRISATPLSLLGCLFFRCYILQLNNVRSLFTAVAFDYIEFNSLAFFQGFETVALDCGEMYEYVAAIFAFNETITLFSIKPFYFASHITWPPKKYCEKRSTYL